MATIPLTGQPKSNMPGKISQGGTRGKHDTSRDRLNSANTSEGGVKRVAIWPEWTEAELAIEKWDLGGGAVKGRDKSKGGHNIVVYDDPDGVLLPLSLADPNSVVWKRPNDESVSDALNKSVPTIVSNPDSQLLDLYCSNKHLFHSQLMCWVVGQLTALWHMRLSLSVDAGGVVEGEKEGSLAWRPWEHIQPHPKGMPAPQINLSGKYCIRIYWMGCWRKVTVDDKLPFLEKQVSRAEGDEDKEGQGGGSEEKRELVPLYPRTTVLSELWPALLTKAILKVVALDYTEGCPQDEFGDSSVVHMLTGWIPFNLKTSPPADTWNTLTGLLPLWKRPPEQDGTENAFYQAPSQAEEKETSSPPTQDKYIIMGSFSSWCPSPVDKPLTASAVHEISKSESLLKKFNIIPSDYSLSNQPSYPVLLTQLRDQLLIPPPKEPPLPDLQAPYYLGLTFRQRCPWLPTPPPTPPPTEPRFIELLPTVFSRGSSEAIVARALESAKVGSERTISDGTSRSPNKSTVKVPSSDVGRKSPQFIGKPASGKTPALKCKQSMPEIVVDTCNLKWMDYLDFLSTFKKVHLFRSPHNFKHRDTYFDLPKTCSARAGTASSSKKGISNSHLSSSSKQSATSKDNNYLFVDSPDPINLLFVFTSLSNWREGGKDTHRYPLSGPSSKHLSQGFNLNGPSISVSAVSDLRPMTPSSTQDPLQPAETGSGPAKGDEVFISAEGGEVRQGKSKVLCGSLVVEMYSWMSTQLGDPVLQISTTGIKGEELSLPPGRHLFKLHIRVPIGHHLEIFSPSSFTLANEDLAFTHLGQDCSMFVSCSTGIVQSLMSSSEHFGNLEELEKGLKSLSDTLSKCGLTSGHAKLLLSSALYSWSINVKDCELTNKMQTAWKAFLFKAFRIIEEQLPSGPFSTDDEVSALRSQLKAYYNVKTEGAETIVEVPEAWEDREPTAEEESAAKVISSSLRHYIKARMEDSMVPGSPANHEALEMLTQSVPKLEPQLKTLGATMLYGLFKLDPSLAEAFSFYKDMTSQGYSTVYCGSFPPLQPNSWTIILRKTLFISEPQLIAFMFNCPLPTSILRVIDNDTMAEMPQVFQSTVPQQYRPNKKGYTLQAEAWLTGVAVSSEDMEDKKWKLRIVTSNKDRPPILEGVTSDESMVAIDESFHKQEMMNYCLPDREEVLFRYLLIPLRETECQVSLQATTSKQDALIKFEVLDNEDTIVAVEGRGVCTIPLCFLQPSNTSEDTAVETTEDNDQASHKYMVQCRVLRKSWPFAETAWPQVASLGLNRQILDERAGSGQKPGSGGNNKKSTKGKERRKTANVVQPSPLTITQPQIDSTKPHWMLTVVTKGPEDCVELKKDTERVDKLKSMVQAWEAEQPGRCKEAQESRQKFLDARAIQDEKATDDELNSTSTIDCMLGVPRPNTGPVKIWQMDLTPFIIKESDTPILLDETVQAQRLAERQKLFKEYRSSRQAVLDLRNEDRQHRNEAKSKQIELAEKWQAELDALRKKLNSSREGIREKYLVKERAEAERLRAAQQEENQSAMGGRDSKLGKAKGAKKKK